MKSQENREIDLSRAKVHRSAAAVQNTAASGTKTLRADQQAQPVKKTEGTSRKTPKKRGKGKKIVLIAVLCVLLVLIAGVGAVYLYADHMMQESDLGSFDSSAAPVPESESGPEEKPQDIVPPDLEGVTNFLVLGLDYDSDDPLERDEKHPNTDMIMYVRLDANNHSMKMLQFPRDIFVGEAGGHAGKINGILAHNVDAGNGLGAVKNYIEQNFGLPVDHYVTIDVDGLKAVVDAFYGIELYIPQDMRYYNETTGALEGELLKGWRKLTGEQCEFFLRYRQGLPRADIDRLVMQRQFYAALFRRLQTATVGDIAKLLPVAEYYLRTDIPTIKLMSMAIEVSTMDGSSITIGRVPVYGTDQFYHGSQPVVMAKPEMAALLNEYFRPADSPIAPEDIGTPEWPTVGGPTEVAMSTMSEEGSLGADERPDA